MPDGRHGPAGLPAFGGSGGGGDASGPPAAAAAGVRPAPSQPQAQRDAAWVMLERQVIAPGTIIDMLAIQPRTGLAILEIPPHWTEDAIGMLRARLAHAGFAKRFPGHLPIIHRPVRSGDLPGLRDLLAGAFVGQPPITLPGDADWVGALRDILLAPLPPAPTKVAPGTAPDNAAATTGPAAVDAKHGREASSDPRKPTRPAPAVADASRPHQASGRHVPPPEGSKAVAAARAASAVPDLAPTEPRARRSLVLAGAFLVIGSLLIGGGIMMALRGVAPRPVPGGPAPPMLAREVPAGPHVAPSSRPFPLHTESPQPTASGPFGPDDRSLTVAPAPMAQASVAPANRDEPTGTRPLAAAPGTAVPSVVVSGTVQPNPPLPAPVIDTARETPPIGAVELSPAATAGTGADARLPREITAAAVPRLSEPASEPAPEPPPEGAGRAVVADTPASASEPDATTATATPSAAQARSPRATMPGPEAEPRAAAVDTPSAEPLRIGSGMPLPVPFASAAQSPATGETSTRDETPRDETPATSAAAGPEARPAPEAAPLVSPNTSPQIASAAPRSEEPLPGDSAARPDVFPAAPASVPLPGEILRPPPPSNVTAPDVTRPAEAAPMSARPGVADALTVRGKALLALGDVASARLFFRRAAEDGNGEAAFLLGSTYDPQALEAHGARGIAADPAEARRWYERAVQLGEQQAAPRLRALATAPREPRR